MLDVGCAVLRMAEADFEGAREQPLDSNSEVGEGKRAGKRGELRNMIAKGSGAAKR